MGQCLLYLIKIGQGLFFDFVEGLHLPDWRTLGVRRELRGLCVCVWKDLWYKDAVKNTYI